MINEYIRYRIPADQHQVFLLAYAAAGEHLRESLVCHGYELSQCEQESECFILRIRWSSTQDHLQKFRGSQAFQGFFAAIKPYVSNIEEMRHYALTDVQWHRDEAPGTQAIR